MALKGKILLETSAIVKQDIPYTAEPNQGGMPFSGMIKLKFLKVCRTKSIKVSIFYFSFILEFFNLPSWVPLF